MHTVMFRFCLIYIIILTCKHLFLSIYLYLFLRTCLSNVPASVFFISFLICLCPSISQFLPIYTSINLSISIYTSLFISVYQSIFSIFLSINIFTSIQVFSYPSVHLSQPINIYFGLSFYQYLSLISIHLSQSLYIFLSV